MCWAPGRHLRAARFLACLVCAGAWAGCARPQGTLFPALPAAQVWPPAPAQPRIKLVGRISNSSDLKARVSAGEAFREALRGPRPSLNMVSPHAVAYHPRGLLAVTDPGIAAVHLIDLNARTHIRVTGWGDERFSTPVCTAWVGDRLFVTDVGRGEVVELDETGQHHGTFGSGDLERPVGIAYATTRRQLYIVDRTRHHIVRFGPDGRKEGVLGEHGTGPGQFNFPTHLAWAGERLLVADSGNFRVQLLDLDGRCLKTIGKKGNAAGDFALPKGVAFDGEGHLYVVDSQFENVQVFDEHGQLLMAFGEEGRALGRFWLPAGIAIDNEDRVWVADGGNHRIQVFQYLRATSCGEDV